MRFSTNIIVNRPITKVFEFFRNPRNLRLWVKDLKQFKTQKGKRSKEGDTGILVFEDKEGILEVSEIIETYERNERVVTQLSHKGMDSTIEVKFLDLGETTKILVKTQVKLKPWAANFFALFMKGEMQRQQEGDYRRLKKALETGA